MRDLINGLLGMTSAEAGTASPTELLDRITAARRRRALLLPSES